MRDSRTMTDQLNDCGETEELDEDVKDKVRKLVCANAKGRSKKEQVAFARELILMLGLHPTQDDEDRTLAPPSAINHFS